MYKLITWDGTRYYRTGAAFETLKSALRWQQWLEYKHGFATWIELSTN